MGGAADLVEVTAKQAGDGEVLAARGGPVGDEWGGMV